MGSGNRQTRPWANGPLVGAIQEAASNEDVLLSRVWGMSLDSKGRVYVKDEPPLFTNDQGGGAT